MGASYGSSLANAGDVNGDGIDDLLVGASEYDDVPASNIQGRMFLYLGSANGLEEPAVGAVAIKRTPCSSVCPSPARAT
ncbi:MAG: FG-GAP repeat protein [Planctomycetes bacterium]|nr:FG-GAP repeat protein [Planctomycetota bacterium]